MNVEIDISKVVLKTDRLVLRAFEQKDLDDFFEYASVDGVGQMAGWSPHKNKQESQDVLNKFIKNKRVLAITKDGKTIGSVGIEKYNEKEYPELESYKARSLGFVLSKDYWGQGLMPEAAGRVIDYLFNDLDIEVLMCGYLAFNKQSARVQQKLGFEFYKEIKHATHDGKAIKAFDNILINPKYEKQIAPKLLNKTEKERAK